VECCGVEGARGGCGYEEVGCGWVGGGCVVSWGEKLSDERSLVSLVSVWAKFLFAPRTVSSLNWFPARPGKQLKKNEDKTKNNTIPEILKTTRS